MNEESMMTEIKNYLRIDEDYDDVLIETLIKSAEKITEEDSKDGTKKTKSRKKTEMDNLENVLGLIFQQHKPLFEIRQFS